MEVGSRFHSLTDYSIKDLEFFGWSYLLPKLLDRIREGHFGDILPIQYTVSCVAEGCPAVEVLAIVRVDAGGRVPVVVTILPWYLCGRHAHKYGSNQVSLHVPSMCDEQTQEYRRQHFITGSSYVFKV